MIEGRRQEASEGPVASKVLKSDEIMTLGPCSLPGGGGKEEGR